MPSSVPYSPVARGSEAVAKQTALSIATTVPTAQCFIVTANGEVEGPDNHVGRAPRAHTVPRRPRRRTTGASRPPPTIVRRRHCGRRATETIHIPARGCIPRPRTNLFNAVIEREGNSDEGFLPASGTGVSGQALNNEKFRVSHEVMGDFAAPNVEFVVVHGVDFVSLPKHGCDFGR